MAAMIDAVVLIHAFGVAVGRITSDSKYWDSARASHHLVDQSDAVVLSAITWFEVMRGMTAEQRESLNKWRSRIQVIPIDARVASRAAKIYSVARKSSKVCPKCFCFKNPLICDVCGNQRSEPQRSNDILMVATAELASDVSVLYSWDKGVIALGEHVGGLDIRNPDAPPPQQIDLLVEDIRDANRPKNKRSKARRGE